MKKWMLLLSMMTLCISLAACAQTKSNKNDADVKVEQGSEQNIEQEETEGEATANTTVYHFGDTVSVSDGMFEFTPVFEGFTDKLANWPDKDYMTPNGQFSGNSPYVAADEKVMMYFSGTINYVGDSKKNEEFKYDFTVDYDDGYLFYFTEGDAWNNGNGYHSGCGITDNVESGDWDYECSATFEPLSSNKTRYVRFCIEVPNQLQTDSQNTMITFHINGEDYSFAMG